MINDSSRLAASWTALRAVAASLDTSGITHEFTIRPQPLSSVRPAAGPDGCGHGHARRQHRRGDGNLLGREGGAARAAAVDSARTTRGSLANGPQERRPDDRAVVAGVRGLALAPDVVLGHGCRDRGQHPQHADGKPRAGAGGVGDRLPELLPRPRHAPAPRARLRRAGCARHGWLDRTGQRRTVDATIRAATHRSSGGRSPSTTRRSPSLA